MTDSNCNPPGLPAYWSNTVILITWDDWGGWYDHVSPPGVQAGYINGGGNGIQYVYGFRVPLLVVSAYTKNGGGYVSGAWNGEGNPPTSCPSNQYCHDFGSILNFIEYVFGTGGNYLGPGEISPSYHYADYYAMDGRNVCGQSTCPYSLSDFFGSFSTPNGFTPISAPYDWRYFVFYSLPPQQPDNDGGGTVEPR